MSSSAPATTAPSSTQPPMSHTYSGTELLPPADPAFLLDASATAECAMCDWISS